MCLPVFTSPVTVLETRELLLYQTYGANMSHVDFLAWKCSAAGIEWSVETKFDVKDVHKFIVVTSFTLREDMMSDSRPNYLASSWSNEIHHQSYQDNWHWHDCTTRAGEGRLHTMYEDDLLRCLVSARRKLGRLRQWGIEENKNEDYSQLLSSWTDCRALANVWFL